jgi:hypothetical protein
LTGPLAARVAVLAEGSGGWLYNETIGRHVPGSSNLAGRLTLAAETGAGLEATLKIEGSRNRNIGALALQDAGCPPPVPFATSGFCKAALADGEPMGLGSARIAQSSGQEILLSTGESVLTLKMPVGTSTFTSTTAWYHYHFNELEDADGTALRLFNITAPENYTQLSQELRLASPLGSRLEYLAGLYYQADRLEYSHDNSYFFLTPQLASLPPLVPLVPYLPLGQALSFSQPEETYSAFASGTLHMTSAFSASVGLRGSWVRKSYNWNLAYGTAAAPYGDIQMLPAGANALADAVARQAGLGSAGSLAGAREDRGVMPSGSLQYSTAGGLAYFSFTRGWKAGGFNGDAT